MAPDRNESDPSEDAENGVLADTGRIDTAGLGVIDTHTAHVDVSMPSTDEDDGEDDVVDEGAAPISYGSQIQADALDAVAADAGDTFAAAEHADEAIAGELEPETASDVENAAHGDADAGFDSADIADADIVEDAPAPTTEAEPAEHVEVAMPAPLPAPAAAAVARTDPHDVERVHTRHEVTLASKRLGQLSEADRETADLLTADRLLDPHQVVHPEPEGAWRQFVYSLSRKRINLGDSKRARARKSLDRRIAAPLPGGARFVAVLSRKGGVGKTTVTTLLGMALADAREDRIIAIDANPDRGTLAERIARANGKTVRDLVRAKDSVHGYHDVSSIVARDETRLDVLASDADPRVSEAFSDDDYRDVATIAAHYYSIVLTDTGTGIVHSVMGATLDLADQLVIVAGLSIDEARLASETLTWLETNGYADAVRNAVVVLNQARPGAPLVRPEELESHFRSRVRDVVRLPYDPMIAAGGAITYRELQPATRAAARDLAAKVVEGLRTLVHAA